MTVALVQELVDWFEARGVPAVPLELEVRPPAPADASQGPSGG